MKQIETIVELRTRFKTAFTRYAADDARMRCLKAAVKNGGDSAPIDVIYSQSRLLSHSEQEYRYVRLEYVRRLLTDFARGEGEIATR